MIKGAETIIGLAMFVATIMLCYIIASFPGTRKQKEDPYTSVYIPVCPLCERRSDPEFAKFYNDDMDAWLFYECPYCGMRYTQFLDFNTDKKGVRK